MYVMKDLRHNSTPVLGPDLKHLLKQEGIRHAEEEEAPWHDQ